MSCRKLQHCRRGSTLPDLLVVVGIIALLVAMVVPMMLTARSRSARMRCANNLMEIGAALSHYAQDNRQRLPSTRPSSGAVVVPDLSNSGHDSPDPFGVNGPDPNNIPAALFLLLRSEGISPSDVICPGTEDVADKLQGQAITDRSNFTDVDRNLSYSFQNPYADDSAKQAGFSWTLNLPRDFVILADRGPGFGRAAGLDRFSSKSTVRRANSPNHDGDGQNVLYADGRVEFRSTPLCGVEGDNIYATQANTLVDSPRSTSDSILLPARGE